MLRSRGMLLLAVAAAACSSVKVQTEYDQATNFKTYKTYAWIPRPAPNAEQPAAARDPRIREAVVGGIDGALTSKGLTKVEPDQSPDMLIAVYGWAENRLDVRSYGYAYGPSPYGFYPTLATGGVDVHQYRDGTLIIDLVDGSNKQLIWRGTATDSFDPGNEAKSAAKAVAATMKEYPPSTK